MLPPACCGFARSPAGMSSAVFISARRFWRTARTARSSPVSSASHISFICLPSRILRFQLFHPRLFRVFHMLSIRVSQERLASHSNYGRFDRPMAQHPQPYTCYMKNFSPKRAAKVCGDRDPGCSERSGDDGPCTECRCRSLDPGAGHPAQPAGGRCSRTRPAQNRSSCRLAFRFSQK